MRSFYGEGKKTSYFEGWYVKHQKDGRVLALIPAFHVDGEGRKSASLQVITENGSWEAWFPAEEFRASSGRFCVRLGRNVFTEKGLRIDFRAEGLRVRGCLRYGPFAAPQGDVMGPFAVLPIPCRHGILSFAHRLGGCLEINGERVDFTGGLGYIEKDRGTSFPEAYFWSQGNWADRCPACVMASAAVLRFCRKRWTGCLAVVWDGKREYRLATYLGARVIACSEQRLLLRQGRYHLAVETVTKNAYPLKAPKEGGMTRTIRESAACTVHYQFWRDGRLMLDRVCETAGAEFAGMQGSKFGRKT